MKDEDKTKTQVAHNDLVIMRHRISELEQSNQQMSLLIDNMVDVIWRLDFTGQILYVSSPCLSQLGYTIEQLQGKAIDAWIHPEDIERVKRYLRENGQLNLRFLHANQHYIHLDIKATVLEQEIIWISHDISDYFIATEMLQQRNLELETLNKISLIVTSSSQMDTILYEIAHLCCGVINATSAYICDVDLEAGTSTVLMEYFSANASSQERISDMGQVYDLELDFPGLANWVRNPQGNFVAHIDDPELNASERRELEEYGVQSTLTVPLLLGEKSFGYIELWESRHKRYFTEAEVHMIHAIASQVAIMIAHTQLHHDLEYNIAQLEELNQELDAYTHTVAHDLKNPLATIRLYASIIRRQYPEQDPQYIDRIENSVIRMTEMIDQLLDMASIRDISDALEPVNMVRIAIAAVSRFESELDEKPMTIDISPSLPSVMGHGLWLEEVFANLIGNAIKYTDYDHPNPKIIVRGFDQGDYNRYEVIDTGIGISLDHQKHLFDVFSRFHPTKASGFGLGLSIVHRIVTKLKGKVGLESVPGQGSIFWFILPNHKA